MREFSFANGDEPLWEHYYGSEAIWNVWCCDEAYAITETDSGYAVAGYLAGNGSKIPDPLDPYQPDFLVLEDINSNGDSNPYTYNLNSEGYNLEDACCRDILLLTSQPDTLLTCGWFFERYGTPPVPILRGYVERRATIDSSPDTCIVMSNPNINIACESIVEENDMIFVLGICDSTNVRKEIIWALDASDLSIVDCSTNRSINTNEHLLMSNIISVGDNFYLTIGESYLFGGGSNELALTLWHWNSDGEAFEIQDEATFDFDNYTTSYIRQGGFDGLLLFDNERTPIGVYAFCAARIDDSPDQNGVLLAYIEIDNWNTSPSFEEGSACLFIQPDGDYNIPNGNEIGGSRIDCVTVNDSTVAVCVGGAGMRQTPNSVREGIWIFTVGGLDTEPSKDETNLCYQTTLPSNIEDDHLQPCIHSRVNPVTSSTILSYSASSRLYVYTIEGRIVWTHTCEYSDGQITWNGSSNDGSDLPQGQYFIVATGIDGLRAIERIVLLD